MPRVMFFDAFRQQTLASALSSASERGAAAFRFHARAKPVLAFARAFGWLKGAFHIVDRNGASRPRKRLS
jgi:hypothetical protein